MNQIYCRVKAAYTALGIGRSKFYEMMKAGEIQSIKVGTMRLVVCDSLTKLAPVPTPGFGPVVGERERTAADTKVKKVRLRPRVSVRKRTAADAT